MLLNFTHLHGSANANLTSNSSWLRWIWYPHISGILPICLVHFFFCFVLGMTHSFCHCQLPHFIASSISLLLSFPFYPYFYFLPMPYYAIIAYIWICILISAWHVSVRMVFIFLLYVRLSQHIYYIAHKFYFLPAESKWYNLSSFYQHP